MQKGILGSRKENIKKGITPVIAIILLLLITISMVGVSFVFMQRIRQTAEQSGEKMLDQQLTQFGTQFKIEGVDKNKVYIRNTGSVDLKDLAFYVNNVKVDSNNPMIAINTIGTISLNDAQLAQLPDPAELKVTSAGFTSKITADFYGKYAVGYWKFDEGSGTTASDSSGNGNIGILLPAGSAPQWVDGKYGKALSFDGSNDYVGVPDSASFRLPQFTVSAWIKLNAADSNPHTIIFKEPAGVTNYWLIYQGRLAEIAFSTGGAWHGAAGTTILQPGIWYYLVGTYDGQDIRIFVDGIQERSNAFIGTPDTSSASVDIGGSGGSYRIFNGAIDEVRILNMARSMTTG